jgi:hypothetical protein
MSNEAMVLVVGASAFVVLASAFGIALLLSLLDLY